VGHVGRGDRDEISRRDAGGIGDDRQQRQHQHRRHEPWYDQIGHRIVRQRLESVDLLRYAHRADLGRHARADASGEHERGEQRPELEDDALSSDPRHRRKLRAREELVERLKGGDRADERGDGEDEGERIDTDVAGLLERERQPGLPVSKRPHNVSREERALPDVAKESASRSRDLPEDDDPRPLRDGERRRAP
jgi:hypothetical protein